MCNVHARLFKFLLPLGLPYGSVLFTTRLVRGTVANSLYASAGFKFFPFAMVGAGSQLASDGYVTGTDT
jgi:hypothetical protein